MRWLGSETSFAQKIERGLDGCRVIENDRPHAATLEAVLRTTAHAQGERGLTVAEEVEPTGAATGVTGLVAMPAAMSTPAYTGIAGWARSILDDSLAVSADVDDSVRVAPSEVSGDAPGLADRYRDSHGLSYDRGRFGFPGDLKAPPLDEGPGHFGAGPLENSSEGRARDLHARGAVGLVEGQEVGQPHRFELFDVQRDRRQPCVVNRGKLARAGRAANQSGGSGSHD